MNRDGLKTFVFALKELGVKKRLDECFSSGRIESYSEKLKLVEKEVKKYNRLFVLEPRAEENLVKDDVNALQCREKGNDLYREGILHYALYMYNISLCSAASPLNKALAFGNRSAVFFEMGCFDDCRKNIELAKQFDILSEKLTNKLNERWQKCLGKTSRSDDANIYDQRFTRHEQIPFLSSSVDIKMDNGNGRSFLYARHDLLPGAVVIKEEITCHVFPFQSPFCSYCMKRNVCFIPCPHCAIAVYCDEECMSKGYERCHKFECKSVLYLANIPKRGLLLFRQICMMLFLCGGVQGLQEFWKNRSPQRRSWGSVKHCDYTELTPFEVILSGTGFQSNQDWYFELTQMLYAVYLKEIWLKYTDFKDVFQTDEQKQMLYEIVCASFSLCQSGFGGITIDVMTIFPREMAAASPNVAATFQDNKINLEVIQPIEKGAAVVVDPSRGRKSNQNFTGDNRNGVKRKDLLWPKPNLKKTWNT